MVTNNKTLLFLIVLAIISLIILFSFHFKPTNIEKSIGSLRIKKANNVFTLYELYNHNSLKYVAFFSFECPSCKALLNNKLLREHIFLINIDYNKEVPSNVHQLMTNASLEIFYIPYIVELDSAMVILKEYKFAEIESKIKNGGRL